MKLFAKLIFCWSFSIISGEFLKLPTGDRLDGLRNLMREHSTNNEEIFAYIVPSTDAHQASENMKIHMI